MYMHLCCWLLHLTYCIRVVIWENDHRNNSFKTNDHKIKPIIQANDHKKGSYKTNDYKKKKTCFAGQTTTKNDLLYKANDHEKTRTRQTTRKALYYTYYSVGSILQKAVVVCV